MAQTMLDKGMLTMKTARKFCDCFRFNHDKKKLEEYERKMRSLNPQEKREKREDDDV